MEQPVENAMQSRDARGSNPEREPQREASPGKHQHDGSRAMLLALVASVSVGLGVMVATSAALAAEPGNEAARARVMTVASLGRAAIGNLSERAASAEPPCASEPCLPLNQEAPDQEPREAHVPTAAEPIDQWKRDGGPVSRGGDLAGLTGTEDRHLGLRILSPLYAIVAMPSQPAWSPAAERPVVQRILVGFRLVVPF